MWHQKTQAHSFLFCCLLEQWPELICVTSGLCLASLLEQTSIKISWDLDSMLYICNWCFYVQLQVFFLLSFIEFIDSDLYNLLQIVIQNYGREGVCISLSRTFAVKNLSSQLTHCEQCPIGLHSIFFFAVIWLQFTICTSCCTSKVSCESIRPDGVFTIGFHSTRVLQKLFHWFT